MVTGNILFSSSLPPVVVVNFSFTARNCVGVWYPITFNVLLVRPLFLVVCWYPSARVHPNWPDLNMTFAVVSWLEIISPTTVLSCPSPFYLCPTLLLFDRFLATTRIHSLSIQQSLSSTRGEMHDIYKKNARDFPSVQSFMYLSCASCWICKSTKWWEINQQREFIAH